MSAEQRPEGTWGSRWWALRFHLFRTFVGTPAFFVLAVKDGLVAFVHAFKQTWGERWKASERKVAYQRFRNVR